MSVIFCLLSDADPVIEICQWLTKTYHMGIWSDFQAPDLWIKSIDEALWSYDSDLFIPHLTIEQDQDWLEKPIQACPICLISDNLNIHQKRPSFNQNKQALWANAWSQNENLPESIDQFDLVFELVLPDENLKQISRKRYRNYQQAGLSVKTSTLLDLQC
jgi:DNA polymerase IIIc chi subunit